MLTYPFNRILSLCLLATTVSTSMSTPSCVGDCKEDATEAVAFDPSPSLSLAPAPAPTPSQCPTPAGCCCCTGKCFYEHCPPCPCPMPRPGHSPPLCTRQSLEDQLKETYAAVASTVADGCKVTSQTQAETDRQADR